MRNEMHSAVHQLFSVAKLIDSEPRKGRRDSSQGFASLIPGYSLIALSGVNEKPVPRRKPVACNSRIDSTLIFHQRLTRISFMGGRVSRPVRPVPDFVEQAALESRPHMFQNKCSQKSGAGAPQARQTKCQKTFDALH
jgi:hypothetical protein